MKIFAETERIILRTLLPSDNIGMFQLDSDPDVHQYLGKNPVTNLAQIDQAISSIRQQYIDNGIARWAIIDKKTNDFIGWAGLKLVTETTNNHINYYDLGYRLRKEYWGKGIATECAVAALKYGFTELSTNEIYAIVECENIGSNKILSKIGFQLIETFTLDHELHNWYKIEKKDFEAINSKI